jgi:hypothetical protein
MTTYRYTGLAAGVLADGRPLAPGQTVKSIDAEDPHNAGLLESGALQELTEPSKTSKTEVSK